MSIKEYDCQHYHDIYNLRKNYVNSNMFNQNNLWQLLINWKNNQILKRLLKNAGYLVSGNVLNSISGLIVIMLIARVLGPEEFGVLALIQSYVLVIDRLINFQSWQVVIKYGSHEVSKNNNGVVKKLFKFGYTVDIISAFLGTIISIIGVYVASIWFHWDSSIAQLAILYSFTILFHIEGTPTGILRLFDKFKIFALKDFIVSITRLLLVLTFYFYAPDLKTFLLIYMVTSILGNVLLNIYALRETNYQNIIDIPKCSLKNYKTDFPKIWEFLWTTNLHGSIRMITMELDLIIVGGVLGKSAAGTYQVAKKFSLILNRVSQPLYTAIYPELTKLFATNKIYDFKLLILKSGLIAGVSSVIIWICFYVFGDFFIYITLGDGYQGVFPIALFLMSAVCISITTFPVTPGLLAIGKPKIAFNVLAISTLLYLPILIILLNIFGVIGGGMAYLFFYITWSLIIGFYFLNQIQKNDKIFRT